MKHLLNEYFPCEALYMGNGFEKERNPAACCYQYKEAHGSMHQTSAAVHKAI